MSLLNSLSNKLVNNDTNKEFYNSVELNKLDENESSFLSSIVQLEDSIPVESRIFNSDYIPVANLIKEDFCARKWLLARRFAKGTDLQENVSGNMRIVWEMGRSVEKHIRNQLISFMKYENILGSWKCKCGHKNHKGFYSPSTICEKCGGVCDVYGEFTVTDKINGISGNPDFVYFNPKEQLYVPVEIKSIKKGKDKNDKTGFLGLVNPVADHIIQLACYRRLLIKNGFEVTNYGRILYCSKDFIMETPYKEFKVDLTEYDGILDLAWDKAKIIYDIIFFNRTGDLPQRLSSCSSASDKMAKDCKMCQLCFNL
jgi:hypothetical protein